MKELQARCSDLQHKYADIAQDEFPTYVIRATEIKEKKKSDSLRKYISPMMIEQTIDKIVRWPEEGLSQFLQCALHLQF